MRALEGRRFDDASQITPPDSAGDRPDGDDSGDLFLKIAREDSSRRGIDSNGNYGDNQSAIVSGLIVRFSNCFGEQPSVIARICGPSVVALARFLVHMYY